MDNEYSSGDESGSGSGLGSGSSVSNSGNSSTNDGSSTRGDDSTANPGEKKKASIFKSFKALAMFILMTLAAVAAYLWYIFLDDNETQKFEDEFYEISSKVVDVFHQSFESKLLASSSLATALTAYVEHSSSAEGSSWPRVSFPNFERRTAGTRRLASASAVWFSPLVDDDNRDEWEQYASDNQDMLQSNFSDPFDPSNPFVTDDSSSSVSSPYVPVEWNVEDGIYLISQEKAVGQEQGTGPYAPIWQSAPGAVTSTIAMYNQRNEELRRRAIDFVAENKQTYFTPTQVQGTQSSLVSTKNDIPRFFSYSPIFDSLNMTTVVGELAMDIGWSSVLKNAATASPAPLTVIIENTFDQAFTFELDDGSVVFLQEGADYSENSLGLMASSTYQEFLDMLGYTQTDETAEICLYRIKVFPTKEFENKFLTDVPLLSSIGVAFIFVLTAVVFVAYDYLVERRQRKLMDNAKRSNAIVRSMFPAAIRDRLMKGEKDVVPDNFMAMETNKMQIKSYLTEAPMTTKKKNAKPQGAIGSAPIADFFPDTSIMFADISGFSAWASTREPSQVFTLLETIYGAMDKAARRLGVFKVETVGDCYVAAAGLPEPRDDHAILLVRFANSCLQKVNQLTSHLEDQLGPGTADLTARFGIHSGPVTAGVLRGEKSRFQLFGDTMNTAARLQTSGAPNMIHISKETADLVNEAGKSQWIEPRKDLVKAKGKGIMQTFWVKENLGSRKNRRSNFTHSIATESSSNSESTDSEDDSNIDPSAIVNVGASPVSRSNNVVPSTIQVDKRIERMIVWNVEMMMNLLKKIVGRRNVVEASAAKADPSIHGSMPLDEVVEVIDMPEYNEEAALKMNLDFDVELPKEIRSELTEFVTMVAKSYRNNPFHNFEHASHVAMSALKLMNRIINSEKVDYSMNSNDEETERAKKIAKALHEHTFGISSDPVTQFAVAFAALVHDAGHTGVANFILAKEEPDTAEKYKNKSIAEQRSVDICWNFLMQGNFENLRRCLFPTKEELRHFRQLVVNSVLATDIFDKELSALRKARWQKAFHPEESALPAALVDHQTFERKATIVIEHIIQASDVAHTMQHYHVYQKWNERLYSEMYAAFREGRADKDPSIGWYKGEIWFFDNYVIPLAKKLEECGVFGVSSAEYLNYATENRNQWEREGEEICRNMVAKYKSLYDLKLGPKEEAP